MSRYVLEIEEGSVAYGLDKSCGYFMQLFNYRGVLILDIESNPPEWSDAVKMNRGDIAEYLNALGVPDEMTDRIILDLEI